MDRTGESSATAAGPGIQDDQLPDWDQGLRAWFNRGAEQNTGGGHVASTVTAGGGGVADAGRGGVLLSGDGSGGVAGGGPGGVAGRGPGGVAGGGSGGVAGGTPGPWLQEQRLGKLVEEAKTAVELSILHQEALWQIFVYNAGLGPVPLISPALMPNVQTKLDTSIDFCTMALECLQEVRGLMVPSPQLPLPGFAAELGAFSGTGWEADSLVQQGQQTGGYETAVSSTQEQVPKSLPSKVRPRTPLAPLQVPTRPNAYRATAIDHAWQDLPDRLTPTIYTAYRGSRSMATPNCDILPLVPSSIIASDVVGSSAMAVNRAWHQPAGPDSVDDIGYMISNFFSTTSQPSRSSLDTSSEVPAQTDMTKDSPDKARREVKQEQEQRTIRQQRPRARTTATQSKRYNPLGETRRMTLQHGADPERDIPDDGFTWRKYGQKSIRNSVHERGYYRCNQPDDSPAAGGTKLTCKARKYVQRNDQDSSVFNVVYKAVHTCSHGRRAAAPPVLHPQPRYASVAALLQATSTRSELPRLSIGNRVQFSVDTDSDSSTGEFLLDAGRDPHQMPPLSGCTTEQAILDDMTSLMLCD